MEYRRQNNGFLTFMEHWGFLAMVLVAFLCSEGLEFFSGINSKPWIYCFIAGMLLQICGAALIIFAKIPVYRSGQFLTFGIKSVPKKFARFYRVGWFVFLLGVVFSLCLFLSKQ